MLFSAVTFSCLALGLLLKKELGFNERQSEDRCEGLL